MNEVRQAQNSVMAVLGIPAAMAVAVVFILAHAALLRADTALGPGFEPMIAANPTDPQNLAIAEANTARVSLDGGLTWSTETVAILPPGYGPLPGWEAYPPGAFDPCSAFDSQGRLFWSYLAYHLAGGGADILLCELDPSTGAILAGPFKATTNAPSGVFNDKEWLAADANPDSPFAGRLYLVWTEFTATERILTKYSKNHGATWTLPIQVSGAGEGLVTYAHVAVAPNSDVYVAYQSLNFDGCNTDAVSGKVFVARSTDGGVTYPQKTLAFGPGQADVTWNRQDCDIGTQIPGAIFWVGSGQTWVLPDPLIPGNISVVCTDDPDSDYTSGDAGDVYIVRSTDHGQTWTPPQEISDGPLGTFQLVAAAEIDPLSGCLGVAWYDNRAEQTNEAGNYLLDWRYTISTDGGLTFSPSVPINDAPFDPDDGVWHIQFPGPPETTRIGDYYGAALGGGDFHTVWTGNGPNAGDLQETLYDRVPAACSPPCDGDVNTDGVVDPLDAGYVSARFGCEVGTGDPECDAADSNADGEVDPLDVGYVLARFGECG